MLLATFLLPMLGSVLLMMSAWRMSILRELSAHKQRAFFVTAGFFPWFTLFFDLSPIVLWSLIGCILLFLRTLDAFFPHFSRDLTLEEAIRALDHLILSMKSGQSLKNSLQEVAHCGNSLRMSRVLHELVARLDHGGDFSEKQCVAREFLVEIRKIQERGVRMIAATEAFRSQLRTKYNFRRRSGQISLQTRLQAGISCLLYLPLLLFQVRAGQLFEARTLISLALFLIAQAWIHFAHRRFQWKV